MITKAMSLAEVREIGIKALFDAIGPVGMIRFLQQDETGRGDYSTQRHDWLGKRGVRALAEEIVAARLPEDLPLS
jgi:hypothetical protein